MKRNGQKGAALVLTMILLAVLSVMIVSMMYLSQSETWSSHNYKLMNLARDAAESGLHKAVNYIEWTYLPPGPPSDPLTGYNSNCYPVTTPSTAACTGTQVTLRADGGSGTYPVSAVQDAFDAAGQGTLPAGYQSMNYETTAELLSLKPLGINPFTGADNNALRWRITSEGSLTGVQGATVEVAAILDQPVAPLFPYAAFGTSDLCSPPGLAFGGNSNTDSYDSRLYAPPGPPNAADGLLPSGGDVGTNGFLDTGGSVTIHGSLSTPRTGVGACAEGNATNNPDVIADGINELPQIVTYPTPPFPSPAPPLTDQTFANNQPCPASIPVGCTLLSKNNYLLAPGQYGNLSGGSSTVIHLSAGTYNINSLSFGAQLTVVLDGAPVILNIAGCATVNGGLTACSTSLATPISSTGGGFTNLSYNAADLQISYSGSGTLQLRGNSGLAAVVYAPNASITMVGTTDLWGSIIGRSVDLTGTPEIHYDRALGGQFYWPGQYMLQNFTWKKF